MSNPIEAIAISFLKKELASHPELAAKFVDHFLEKTKVGTTLEPEVNAAIIQLVPFLLAEVSS